MLMPTWVSQALVVSAGLLFYNASKAVVFFLVNKLRRK